MNAPFSPKVLRSVNTKPDDTRVAIAFEAVSKVYPARGGSAEVVALAGVTMAIPEGAIVGVIGRSGAGKSTLIRLVNALERPTAGRVFVNGEDVTALGERELRRARRSIGMIFQHFNLLSSRTAFDNVALPLEIAGYSRSKIEATVTPLLDMVGLSDKRGRYPAELSGGQKQRVGIARALATKPRVLLSDEATSALDPETTEQILELLKQINRDLKLTILFITHEMSVVKRLASRVAVIESGRIIEQGDTQTIFSRPSHETTKRFVNSVMGADIPGWIKESLGPVFVPGGKAILQITISGRDGGQAALFDAAREFDVPVEILHGRIDAVAGQPFGTVIVSVKSDLGTLQRVVERLKALTAHVENLGYVA